jgi:hypothetical protein
MTGTARATWAKSSCERHRPGPEGTRCAGNLRRFPNMATDSGSAARFMRTARLAVRGPHPLARRRAAALASRRRSTSPMPLWSRVLASASKEVQVLGEEMQVALAATDTGVPGASSALPGRRAMMSWPVPPMGP